VVDRIITVEESPEMLVGFAEALSVKLS